MADKRKLQGTQCSTLHAYLPELSFIPVFCGPVNSFYVATVLLEMLHLSLDY